MPLANAHYPSQSPEWLLAGQPSGVYRTNLPSALIGDLAVLTTQVMQLVALPLQAGDKVTNLSFKSGATAAGAPTNWWVALYDDSATPALLGQSADQLTAAWAADTTKTLALASPVNIIRSGVYYAAVMVKATTPPSLVGLTVRGGGGFLATDKALAATGAGALTTTAPATQALGTASTLCPKVVAT